jgi:hypothetical protein
MRAMVPLAVLILLGVTTVPVCASGLDKIPDQQSIDALEAKANLAQPREQCFLYAELVHQMTVLSFSKYSAGDVDAASTMLKHIQKFAHKIHLSVGDDNKRLKNAEILLRHSAYRLNEMLHAGNYEDRQLVEQTLAQVNQAESEAMLQVFRK